MEDNPETGTPLGNNCFKIPLAIASKRHGKSGGARVVTHFFIQENTVFLLAIYDKNEQSDISDKEIRELLWHING